MIKVVGNPRDASVMVACDEPGDAPSGVASRTARRLSVAPPHRINNMKKTSRAIFKLFYDFKRF